MLRETRRPSTEKTFSRKFLLETIAPVHAREICLRPLPGKFVVSLAHTYRKVSKRLFVGCLTSQQYASVSQGRTCSDNFTCCHTGIEVAAKTFFLTQSQYTDTGPTSPSAGPIPPGAWQGSHWSANFGVTGMTRPRKNPGASGIRTLDLPLSRGKRRLNETHVMFGCVTFFIFIFPIGLMVQPIKES